MKSRLLFLLFLLPLYLPIVSGQATETIRPPAVDTVKRFVNTHKLPAKSHLAPVAIDPELVAAQKKWKITFEHHNIDHASTLPKAILDSVQQAGFLLRDSLDKLRRDSTETPRPEASILTPQISASFKGNKYNGWAPPDNQIAVSDDGYIVSVANSSIFFSDQNGNVLLEEDLNDFLSALNLNGVYFDPRVIYDPVADKFILVVLNGNTPATSTIVVGFSSASNPKQSWWLYTFEGDPTGSNLWFDYPSIGISTEDLYISGNQFTANKVFTQTLIYQLEKGQGYTGGPVTGIHWFDVRDAYGLTDFTIVPVSFGFDGTIGPGIYFVSTDRSSSTDAMLYYTDNSSKNDPNLFAFKANIPKYYAPFNATMKGSTDKLKINDCTVQSGFYADGTIHFVISTAGDDLHSKILYCRLNTNDLSQTSIKIGQAPFEYAYPSVAPFSTTTADKSVLIGFLRSGGSIYPEFRMGVVDHDMNFFNSFPVKEGESFVDASADPLERWGDYSGISRRHAATGPEVWISGCYGKDSENGASNILSTWIARVTDGQAAQPPVADFTANATTISAGQSVTFTDMSTNAPTGWSWTFPGGAPATSTAKNPVVTYNTPGSYAVTLVATNNAGNDTEAKPAYITVNALAQPPVANFSASPTTISAGQSVTFTDLSTNAPTFWTWSFPGGTPPTSSAKNPVVTYNIPGTYSVTLVAANNAGNDSETKAAYITVNALAQPPVANFSASATTILAGQSVTFTDLSTNVPTSWTWSFPGGTPSTATVKSPVVHYNTPGVYSVTLIVANNAGNDSETKAAYITVNALAQPPVANFTSDVVNVSPGGIVQFTDLSGNTPTSWQWSFPGGVPSVSSLQNPIIIYPSAGCFDVTLVATNAAGSHAVTKPCYINAVTAVEDQRPVFDHFVLYPNPVRNERLNVEFEIAQSEELQFFVVDSRGVVVRELLHRRVLAGSNNLAFSTDPLPAGAYYLVVQDTRRAVLRNEKFIVVN